MDVITEAKGVMGRWYIGQTSALHETDGRGPGTISTGRGDYGGASYGNYQFASAVGGVDEYLAGSRYGVEFRGLEPATAAFNARWREIAQRELDAFSSDQHGFIQRQYYDVQLQRLQNAGINLEGRGAAVQDALWSTAVQCRGLTRSVFQSGLKQAYGDDFTLSELTDEQIVRAVQDYKHANVQRNFESSPTLWPSLRSRALSEKEDLVALARYDEVDRHPQRYKGQTYQQIFGEVPPVLSSSRGSVAPMADGMLTQGERGPEVQALQAKLARAGYTALNGQPLGTDGVFGPNTHHAIRQFQTAQGLDDDGKAGRRTLAALEQAVQKPEGFSTATPAPVSTASVALSEANVPAAPGGERIRIMEPYGSGSANRTLRHGISGDEAYRDLKIHHPNTNAEAVRTGDASKADRPSAMVEGELETIRTRGDINGIPLVQKDLILTNRQGDRAVMILNPVAGYVEVNADKWNSVSIWSQPKGHPDRELIGQVLHGERGSSPYKTGDFVDYGAPLIKQSDAGSPGAVHAHIELEPAQHRRYLGDILNDRITLGGKVHAQGPQAALPAMADGMLTQGERGAEVKAMQSQLASMGYTGADGKLLVDDGHFGKNTLAALKHFQRDSGLKDEGRAGPDTLNSLNEQSSTKSSANTPKPDRSATAAPCMRDAAHPEHGRFNQTMEKLDLMEKQRVQAGLKPVFANAQEAERFAGQIVFETKVAGIRNVDSVVARPDGSGLFAVQGVIGDPAAHRVYVDRNQSVSHTLEASTRQVEDLDRQFNQHVQEQPQAKIHTM